MGLGLCGDLLCVRMRVGVMADPLRQVADDIQGELKREIESVRYEMYQVRDLVQDAIGKLTDSFNGLRDNSDAQLQLVTALTSAMDGQEEAEVGGTKRINIRSFVSETDRILRAFVDHIILVSRQSMEMVHRIDELSGQMGQVVELLQDINGIAEQTNVLSLNARIVAARAGQAGHAFSVVAGEVRKLAHNSHDFSDKISEVVGQAKNNIEAAKSIIEVMASKDMSFAIESKGRVDDMMEEVGEIDRFTSETIHRVTLLADHISGQVGTAIMSLQFEDMVTQLSHSMEKKLNVLENFSQTLEQGILSGEGEGRDDRVDRLRMTAEVQKAMFDEVDRGAVQQTSMDEGDIELF